MNISRKYQKQSWNLQRNFEFDRGNDRHVDKNCNNNNNRYHNHHNNQNNNKLQRIDYSCVYNSFWVNYNQRKLFPSSQNCPQKAGGGEGRRGGGSGRSKSLKRKKRRVQGKTELMMKEKKE